MSMSVMLLRSYNVEVASREQRRRFGAKSENMFAPQLLAWEPESSKQLGVLRSSV